MRSNSQGFHFYLSSGGQVEIILQMNAAPVLVLDKRLREGLPDCEIVAENLTDIDDEWERFLAETAIYGCPLFHYKQLWNAETGKVQIEHLSENGFGAFVPSYTTCANFTGARTARSLSFRTRTRVSP